MLAGLRVVALAGVQLGLAEAPRPVRNKRRVRRAGRRILVDADQPMIWRGPMVTQALEQLLRDTQWKNLEGSKSVRWIFTL